MKKVITLFIFVSLFHICRSQEVGVGYSTTDVGAEFQYYKSGKFIGLHLAANAKLHNSFHAMIGYYSAGNPTSTDYYNFKKGGFGLGLGYRYYTDLRPHGFFIGAAADLFTNKIMLNTQTPEGPYTSLIFIPSFQTGYMLLINDLFFITPTVAFGYKTNLQSKLSADEKKAVVMLGISAGVKF